MREARSTDCRAACTEINKPSHLLAQAALAWQATLCIFWDRVAEQFDYDLCPLISHDNTWVTVDHPCKGQRYWPV